jgi:hypothetical protein
MTAGGVDVTFVTVTVPSALVMMRIGATTRAVAAVRAVDVDVPVAVVVDAVVVDAAVDVVAGRVAPRLRSGGFAARVGLAVTDDVRVGVRIVVLVPVAADVIVVGPAAN